MRRVVKISSNVIWHVLTLGALFHLVEVETHKTVELPTLVVEAKKTPPRFSSREIRCLADNTYHEARGEGLKGWLGVIHVTLNRVESKKFPADLCDVVYEKTHKTCQYSWVCDKNIQRDQKFRNTEEYHNIKLVASITANTDPEFREDLTRGSHFYKKVGTESDFFAENLKPTTTIGKHRFYVEK